MCENEKENRESNGKDDWSTTISERAHLNAMRDAPDRAAERERRKAAAEAGREKPGPPKEWIPWWRRFRRQGNRLLTHANEVGILRGLIGKLPLMLLIGVWNWIWRVVDFLRSVVDGYAPAHLVARRNEICDRCPSMVRYVGHVKRDGSFKRWCNSCNCPKWKMSELSLKNKLLGHACPQGRHQKMDDDVMESAGMRGA